MKLIPLPQVPQPAIVHKLKDYFSLPQLIDYANAVAEAKCAELENVLEQNHIKHDSTTRALEAAEDSALQWKSRFELEHRMKCEWITRAESAEAKLEGAYGSLREHMAMVKELQGQLATLKEKP